MNEKTRKALALALALAATACGKSGGGGGAAAGGGFDRHALDDLQQRVGGAKIADAAAMVEKVFGPARKKDPTFVEYAAIDGGACYHFGLAVGEDGTVHGVQQSDAKPGQGEYADCEKLAKSPPVK